MKRVFLSCMLAFGLAVSSPAMATNAAGAKAFVDKVAGQVLEIVKNESLDRAKKQAKLETLFSDKVDIAFVGKFVLGKNWRTATSKQQQDYLAAYKPFIIKNYAGRLAKYSGQTYTLKNSRIDGDASVVTMAIHDTNGQDVIVDYRIRGDGAYRIIDITVEGVSLLTTQRSEFNSIVENKGVDGLIEALRRQVADRDA